ncbi:MAG TPA: ParA family protein [Hyphomicrobiaceae bacterium]|jgi:chromosome partitioning protein|nr:ParA family protein [Hyphomicrobiaceae bacterium]
MRNTITVMNAKGGVGKSTLVLALAETLANDHGKRVLVIDSDAQASVSHMLMQQDRLDAIQAGNRTMVDYLIGSVLKDGSERWQDYAVGDVSDVDDARSIDLLPSDTHLTLFEREVSKTEHERELRAKVGTLLREARETYDLILIDSAPGLSVLTESWLRESDFYVAPTRPDYISTRGLEFLRQFRKRDPDMGFAEPLGVIINMKDPHSIEDNQYEEWLRDDPEHRCFQQTILRVSALQSATRFAPRARSYWAKYPGQTGASLRELASELLWRVAASQPGATYQSAPNRARA